MSKHTCLSLSSRFLSRAPVMSPFSLNLSQQTVILFCRFPSLSCMLAEWCWPATILMSCSLSRKRFLYFILLDFTAANWSVSLLIIACVFLAEFTLTFSFLLCYSITLSLWFFAARRDCSMKCRQYFSRYYPTIISTSVCLCLSSLISVSCVFSSLVPFVCSFLSQEAISWCARVYWRLLVTGPFSVSTKKHSRWTLVPRLWLILCTHS